MGIIGMDTERSIRLRDVDADFTFCWAGRYLQFCMTDRYMYTVILLLAAPLTRWVVTFQYWGPGAYHGTYNLSGGGLGIYMKSISITGT